MTTCLVTYVLFLAFLPLTITPINDAASKENSSLIRYIWKTLFSYHIIKNPLSNNKQGAVKNEPHQIDLMIY